MKGCSLVDEFLRNKRKYVVYKHQYSRKSNNERTQKIIKFLQFCCLGGVKCIRDIQKSNYDEFLRHLNYSYSLETIRKYKLALSEFANRAKLDFKVVKNVDKQKKRKFLKLKETLKDCECNLNEYRDEIMKLF